MTGSHYTPSMLSASRTNRKDRPWWVKQRRFVVPSTLQTKIRSLPEDIQIKYCFIVSKVVIETKKFPAVFENISSAYFDNFVGSGYRAYLNQLKAWNIIQINEGYLNSGGGGFCKSYRLTPSARRAGKVKICFEKKLVRPFKDHSELKDRVVKFVHGNLKRLAVRTDLLAQANVVDEVDAEDWAERIHFEAFDVHYSPHARRLYHAVINMPRVARKNLIFKEDASVALFEYDIKSCTPVTLLGLVKDPKERATLTALLDGDIYTAIAIECGENKDRAEIKVDFLKFINGAVHNYVFEFFHRHLPNLAALLVKGKEAEKGMAWFGQRVESEIMAQEVPRQLIQAVTPNSTKLSTQSLTSTGNPDDGILYIPMHDGWLGVEHNERRIASVVRNEFYRRLGYWVTVTKTNVATGDETVLASGVPAVSDDGHPTQ